MRGPLPRRVSIAASTPKLDVDNRFPLKKYYRAAENLLRQADIYREEGNVVELFVLLLRFTSLVGETIPEHKDYPTVSVEQKAAYKQKCTHILLELEKLKPEVQKQVYKLNNAITLSTSGDNSYEWPLMAKNPTVQGFSTQKTQNELVAHTSQNMFQYNPEKLKNMSLKFLPPKKETLSRHSFLGPDGLRARWIPPVAPLARIEYPSNSAINSTEVLSLGDQWNDVLSNVEFSKLEAPSLPQPDDAFSQLSLIRQPSPPPLAAPVQDLPIMADLMQLCKQDEIPGPEAISGPLSTVAEDFKQTKGPKELHIPAKMMDEFLKFAKKNTNNNIETCGVLAGSLKNAVFYITALIIPKQQATSNTCQTVNEEDIFDWQDKRGLFQLGWIHTHPSQSCFMSSVDLHTHYSYQVMLPEAIAIVMAPTDNRKKYGIFRLTDPGGIKVIQNCPMRGFHPHDSTSDGSSIYESSSHVHMREDIKYEVVDLR